MSVGLRRIRCQAGLIDCFQGLWNRGEPGKQNKTRLTREESIISVETMSRVSNNQIRVELHDIYVFCVYAPFFASKIANSEANNRTCVLLNTSRSVEKH